MIQKYFLYFVLAIQLSGNVGELYKKIEKRDLQNENIPSIATVLPAYIPEYNEDNSTSSVSLSIKTKSPPPPPISVEQTSSTILTTTLLPTTTTTKLIKTTKKIIIKAKHPSNIQPFILPSKSDDNGGGKFKISGRLLIPMSDGSK